MRINRRGFFAALIGAPIAVKQQAAKPGMLPVGYPMGFRSRPSELVVRLGADTNEFVSAMEKVRLSRKNGKTRLITEYVEALKAGRLSVNDVRRIFGLKPIQCL